MTALHLVVSPYSLCSRDAAAVSAMLLAGRALTYLPRSLEPAGVSRDEAIGSPGFRRVMSAVAWVTPMIDAGVLVTSIDGDDAAADFARARQRIEQDPGLAPLRRFVERRPDLDPGRAIERLARDLTRSGPDPSISVPLAAALDALAERHAYTVLRVDGPSLAQRAERARERAMFACSLPALVQATPGRVLETRRRLEPELGVLRGAIESCIDGLAEEEVVREAAAEYAHAFDRDRHHIERPERDPDDIQTRTAEVVLTGVAHSPDHALHCSALAARRVSRRGELDLSERSLSGRSIIVRLVGR